MRLHALIFASQAGVPMLALAYARKMRGVMCLLGAERWIVEVESRTPSTDELEMKLWLLWQARDSQRTAMQDAAAEARSRADADAEQIARIIAGTD
jgi:polysaccharide pyruvyl transferase WcaK-like protein